jgi:hypothetical protein
MRNLLLSIILAKMSVAPIMVCIWMIVVLKFYIQLRITVKLNSKGK